MSHLSWVAIHFSGFMSEEDDFETPQFRLNVIKSPQRRVHLAHTSPSFFMPPRSDSFASLNIYPKETTEIPRPLGSKAYNETDYEAMFDSNPVDAPDEEIKLDLIREKFQSLHPDPPKIAVDSLNLFLEGKNHMIIDFIDNHHFLPLTSFLQTHRKQKALIVVPSSAIAKWIRSFLIDSSCFYPEDESSQKQAITRLTRSTVQVMFCVANKMSTLSLRCFNVIYIIKAELCENTFSTFSNFEGKLVVQSTPGYWINFPYHLEILQQINELKCFPTAHFENDYLTVLKGMIESQSTVVVAPFLSTCSEIMKKHHNVATQFNSSKYSSEDIRPQVATTSILYSMAKFKHYIFVGFPPNLSMLLMACYAADTVDVLIHIPTAIKCQSLSHNAGIDKNQIATIMQQIFFVKGIGYRKDGDIGMISLAGMDLTDNNIFDLLNFMVSKKLIQTVPFTKSNLSVKIKKIDSDEMLNSSIIRFLSKGNVNSRGWYNVSVITLCQNLNINPVEIDIQLSQLNKCIDYNYSNEKATYCIVKKEFGDDDEFMEMLNEIYAQFSQYEERKDREFDVIYSICKNPESIVDYVTDPNNFSNILTIPHGEVNVEEIKRMLSSHKKADWTPRAVARIVHGISSPSFTSNEWSRTPYWSSQAMTSFKDVYRICHSCACNPSRL